MTEQTQPIYMAKPTKITIPKKRQRKHFDRGGLNKLKESFLQVGQLQPGLCSKEGDKIILIAGQRRLIVCGELDIPFMYCLISEIPDPHKRQLMELHENIIREGLTFIEEAEAKTEIHKAYMLLYGNRMGKRKGWSVDQTAKELGVSAGNLNEDLELAKYAKAIPEVAKASTKTEAKKVIKRLKTGVIRSEALRQATEKSTKDKPKAVSDQIASVEDKLKTMINSFRPKVHCGDMIDLLPDMEPFDVVFFDPPWNVGFDEAWRHTGDREKYIDTFEDYKSSLAHWLTIIRSVMKENSHLYLKFGIVHHQLIYDVLEELHFVTNRQPIIWYKNGSRRTAHPERWPARCYEPIAFAHLGKKRLVKFGQPNVIETKPPSPKMKDIHPSAMHPALIVDILRRSCMPGDRVLDPMCGSGMLGVAAEHLKKSHMLDWTMIDEKKTFIDLSLTNLIKGYNRIVGETDLELEQKTPNFQSVLPGSPEWQEIWNKNPELRSEMQRFTGGEG